MDIRQSERQQELGFALTLGFALAVIHFIIVFSRLGVLAVKQLF
jgi:hypothetical protein